MSRKYCSFFFTGQLENLSRTDAMIKLKEVTIKNNSDDIINNINSQIRMRSFKSIYMKINNVNKSVCLFVCLLGEMDKLCSFPPQDQLSNV